MKKNLEKVFASASVVVAIILIMVLLVTAFGGIETEEFQTKLVQGLLITLSIIYIVLAILTLVLAFISSEAIKEITIRSEQAGSVRVSASVINKFVKNACTEIEGVKCQKVGLVSDDYGVRLKVSVKVVDKDVLETETYLRLLLEDLFKGEFGFRFNSIEIKVVQLAPKYKADQNEINEKVAKKLEELKAEQEATEATNEVVDENVEATEDAPVAEEVVEEAVQEEVAIEEPAVETVEENVEATEEVADAEVVAEAEIEEATIETEENKDEE